MAEGRILKNHISTSERVNNMSYEAMLVYTWCIPHSDDLGLIPASPRKLRAMVAPMWDMTVEQFGVHLVSIRTAGLFRLVTVEDQNYFYIVGHKNEQKGIRKGDRKPTSIAISLSNWDQWDEVINHLESDRNPDGIRLEAQYKLSKDNISKDKLNEAKGSESLRTPSVAIDSSYLKAKARELGGKQ